jgi:hypothetical protein
VAHLNSRGRVTGTSIRPYLAAFNTLCTRAGIASPTKDPVIASIRVGYNRATADRVASRPRSVALPSALGALAVKMTLRSRSPTPITVIAVRFLLALGPMSIQGILPEDVTRTAAAVSSAYAERKAMQANAMTSFSPSLSLLLQTPLLCCPQGLPGRVSFPLTSARLNRGLISLSHQAAVRPRPLRRFNCRSLRSGCMSACHALGVPLRRIMALSGHSSSHVLTRHYLDATLPPCSDARDLFGRFLPPTSS